MTDAQPAPVSIRLVISPTMAARLDRFAEASGMDRTNAIRAALVYYLERHPSWAHEFDQWATTETSISTS